MKLGLAITSLFAASAAAKYAPGQDCRTNKGCDDNCIGSKWSIAIVAGDARMVCDPSNLNSPRYAVAHCEFSFSATSDGQAVLKATQNACNATKGKMCKNSCYLTAQASKEDEITGRFANSCSGESNTDSEMGPMVGKVLVYPTKEEAVLWSECKTSVFA